ncbi:hypothetical protein AAC387_Pa03g4420 [Persea americana]
MILLALFVTLASICCVVVYRGNRRKHALIWEWRKHALIWEWRKHAFIWKQEGTDPSLRRAVLPPERNMWDWMKSEPTVQLVVFFECSPISSHIESDACSRTISEHLHVH